MSGLTTYVLPALKSIQSVNAMFSIATTGTVAISAVTLGKAVIVPKGSRSTNTNRPGVDITLELTSETQVTWARADNNAIPVFFSFDVVEFN